MPPPRKRRRPSRHSGTPRIGGRLDLHGLTTAEARIELRDFLLEAHSIGELVLLVIHGKGSGKLAQLTKAELGRDPRVRDHRPAPAQLGGEGARLVTLESEDFG